MTGLPDSPSKQKTPLRFLLVRHGESEANVDRPLMRELSIPDESVQLTELGFRQADACGAFLAGYLSENPQPGGLALYCSSYMRARQTAQRIYDNIRNIAGYPALRAHESDFLIEQHHGFLDSFSDEEKASLFPEFQAREDMHYNNGSKQFAPMHGGEMRATVSHRVATFMDSVFRERDDHGVTTFVIVSHGITMRQIAKLLLKMPREVADLERNPDNCDVRLLQRHGDGFRKFSDFGSIWRSGKSQRPEIVPHSNMLSLFAEGRFRTPLSRKPKAPEL